MMSFVPFMILAAAVVLIVAGWGAWRASRGAPGLDRLPEAEAMFADCLAAKGASVPRLRVYREAGGGLVLVGPDDMDAATRKALSECDRQIARRFADPG